MLNLDLHNRFHRELALAKKRGKNLDKLWGIIEQLQASQPLAARHRDHKLSGNWQGYRECHIEPDWLLIYKLSDDALILVAIGTHSDLFD